MCEAVFFYTMDSPAVYTGRKGGVPPMNCGNGGFGNGGFGNWGCGNGGGGIRLLGLFAVALGAGILIAAVFPVGVLMFLVAFLLIGCGCVCCRR